MVAAVTVVITLLEAEEAYIISTARVDAPTDLGVSTFFGEHCLCGALPDTIVGDAPLSEFESAGRRFRDKTN